MTVKDVLLTIVIKKKNYTKNVFIVCFIYSSTSLNPVSEDLHLTVIQGWHRLEKYLNIQDCLEMSLKIKFALKSPGKSLKSLEKSLNSTIFCRT